MGRGGEGGERGGCALGSALLEGGCALGGVGGYGLGADDGAKMGLHMFHRMAPVWHDKTTQRRHHHKHMHHASMPRPALMCHRWVGHMLLCRSNPAREAFVELCEDSYVQKMTFDSYLYKTVVPGNPIDDVKLLVRRRSSRRRQWQQGGCGCSGRVARRTCGYRMCALGNKQDVHGMYMGCRGARACSARCAGPAYACSCPASRCLSVFVSSCHHLPMPAPHRT